MPLPPLVEVSTKIPRELHTRFQNCIPIYGGTSWFLETAIAEFVELVEHDDVLQATVAEAVRNSLQLRATLREAAGTETGAEE